MPTLNDHGVTPAAAPADPAAARFRLARLPKDRGFVVQRRQQHLSRALARLGAGPVWVNYAPGDETPKLAAANAFSRALLAGDHAGAQEILALDTGDMAAIPRP